MRAIICDRVSGARRRRGASLGTEDCIRVVQVSSSAGTQAGRLKASNTETKLRA
jgi:hypothetical protein